MDKAQLEMKLREIHQALYDRVPEECFKPLYENVIDWMQWNRLHVIAAAHGCDKDYICLIDQCCKAATREFLGDIA